MEDPPSSPLPLQTPQTLLLNYHHQQKQQSYENSEEPKQIIITLEPNDNEREICLPLTNNELPKQRRKPKLFKQLAVTLSESFRTSSLQGFSNIIKAKHSVIRVIWAMFLIVSGGACCFLLHKSITDYLRCDVVTKIRYIKVRSFKMKNC